jgi:uncharacterized protein (TIGR03437 family)
MTAPKSYAALLFALCVLAADANAQRSRITKPIDNLERATLSGHIHPMARPDGDQGRVSPSLELSSVTLNLSPSASQQADLDQLLTEQQTPGHPNYHRWLSPEEFAQRFGVSDDDLSQITTWLQGQGLTIASAGRGRTWIAVSGSASRIESAFRTELHHYLIAGETHFANATEPSVPAAFAGVVRAIRGLNDFRARPRKHLAPNFSSSRGTHNLAPDDLATIYNIAPLYAAGIDGTGQSLVIAGQTQINVSDLHLFRTNFNLPGNDPQMILVPNAKDPGIVHNDLDEADLDLEWSGAVARKANIIYVYSDDVMVSIQYAIDQNLAPVVSTSYGLCELETPLSDALTFRAWAKQGNAQGITWFAATGDAGGADCGDAQNPGLSVDNPADTPEVTAVGGTEFQEGAGNYWKLSNDPNGASALSYIPEAVWNDSAIDGVPSAGGGGASIFFVQPSWQSGPGVPGDNARHIPDVSLTASADHDGYFVYTSGKLQVYGGTSVPTPAFAGLAALVNHYLVSTGAQSVAGLGNMNPGLYSLAQTTPSVFHDITVGDNIVTTPCSSRTRVCSNTPVGYSAGPGYDSATGLGSVDAYALVTKWKAGSTFVPPPKTSVTLVSNLSAVATTDVVFLVATVTGAETPVGVVDFQAGGSSLGSAALVGSAGTATATLSVNGTSLPLNSATITAAYRDSSANSFSASVTLSVTTAGPGSKATPAPHGVANGASFKPTFAPGMILSVFGSQLAPKTMSASSVPLPVAMQGVAVTVNGVAAPLYYVSDAQLNIQIPYDIVANAAAALAINNNGRVSSLSFNVAAVAPGIFADQSGVVVPFGSAKSGQTITLFITGTGEVSPPVSTGAAPPITTLLSNLPQPVQKATVTVGGVPATVTFIGIPYGLVGVTQINYQVPSGVAIGARPVVVSIGSVQSAPATLNVTN